MVDAGEPSGPAGADAGARSYLAVHEAADSPIGNVSPVTVSTHAAFGSWTGGRLIISAPSVQVKDHTAPEELSTCPLQRPAVQLGSGNVHVPRSFFTGLESPLRKCAVPVETHRYLPEGIPASSFATRSSRRCWARSSSDRVGSPVVGAAALSSSGSSLFALVTAYATTAVTTAAAARPPTPAAAIFPHERVPVRTAACVTPVAACGTAGAITVAPPPATVSPAPPAVAATRPAMDARARQPAPYRSSAASSSSARKAAASWGRAAGSLARDRSSRSSIRGPCSARRGAGRSR